MSSLANNEETATRAAAKQLNPPLLDILGVSWNLEAPVVDLAWDHAGGSMAFSLGDGTLAVVLGSWQRGPRLQPRPGGGVALVEAEEPAVPPRKAVVHEGSCLALAADPAGGFLSGGDDGRVVHMPLSGDGAVLAHLPDAWIDNVATSPEGIRAWSSGRRVQRMQANETREMELPATVNALAFDSKGQCLAMAHAGGVTLWRDAQPGLRGGADGHFTAAASAGLRHLAWPGLHRALAWSPDDRYLVTGMQENALHGWRLSDGGDIEMGGYAGQPRSLSFAGDGRFLATSGSTRLVCWRFDPPGRDGAPDESGIASRVPVTRVACHPSQAVVATGYHNGAVLLCQPGSHDALFVKASGNGAVTALAWSSDGSRLAFGTQEGTLGWLSLPVELFRTKSRP
jgi:WD40 repeat protein